MKPVLCLLSTLALLMACRQSSPPLLNPALRGAAQFNQQSARFQRQSSRDLMGLMQTYHTELQARNPELIQLKYQAMRESPFAFYRATAFLYYHDLRNETALAQGVNVPLQGDFHLENMGTYITSRQSFAYDLNDFDEAVTGPHSWDLARLAVSIHLAADEAGIKAKDRRELIAHFLGQYQSHLAGIQRQPGLLQQPLDERYLTEKAANQVVQARERFSRAGWLEEMTRNGRFRYDDKVLPLNPQEQQQAQAALAQYVASRREGPQFFALKDMASRIAGKGSLGRYRYIFLVEGPSPSPQDDLILEIKEAATPSATYAGARRSSNEAARIVQAYQRFLALPDPYLGLSSIGGSAAYVRELLPKETVNLEKVNKFKEYQDFLDSVALIIARAHARGGQIPALLQQTPALSEAIASFADSYFEQVVQDYDTFRRATR